MSGIGFIKELSRGRLRGVSAQAIGVLIRLVETGQENEPYVVEVGGDKTAMALICRLDRIRFMSAVEELRKHGLLKINENAGNRIWITVLMFTESKRRRMINARKRVEKWRNERACV